jgi:hypothetical protein
LKGGSSELQQGPAPAIYGEAGRRGFEHRWCRKAWASSAPPSANTEGQPIGGSASLGKRLGGSPLRIETAAFLQAWMPNQSGLWPPFEAAPQGVAIDTSGIRHFC